LAANLAYNIAHHAFRAP